MTPMDAKRIIRNRAGCRVCGSIVESKHRHDFVECSCGLIHVDGGTDYLKRGGNLEHIVELSEFAP